MTEESSFGDGRPAPGSEAGALRKALVLAGPVVVLLALVVPEAFWLKVDRPTRLSEMRDVFGRMPGVAAVLEVSAPRQWRFPVATGAGR